jgi:predicted dehydrogenase
MVLLTTPTVRAEPTIAAAEAGRHVFTQGPMAQSVADAAAMADAVRRAGVKFHSQCGARYPRGIALARRAVEKSLLGEIASARVELNWFRPQGYYKGWHGTWSGEGGGAAFHHGRYIIDPFLWVLGSRVVELFAYAGPALREIEHENLTHAAVRYSNGATGTIHASLLNHKQRLTPSGRFEILGRDASMLVGEEYLNQGNPGSSYWKADTTFGFGDGAAVDALASLAEEVSGVPEEASEEYQSRLFLESIANDSDPVVPIEVPMHHVEIVRALYKSAHEGAPVSLPLDEDDPFYSFEGRIA